VELSAALEYKLSMDIPASFFSGDATPQNIVSNLSQKILEMG